MREDRQADAWSDVGPDSLVRLGDWMTRLTRIARFDRCGQDPEWMESTANVSASTYSATRSVEMKLHVAPISGLRLQRKVFDVTAVEQKFD